MAEISTYKAILAYEDGEEKRWNAHEKLGTGVFISYRFAEKDELADLLADKNPYGAMSYRVFTAAEKAAFREVAKKVEAIAGVRFVETQDDDAMLQSFGADIDSGSLAGYANLPFINTGSGTFTDPKHLVMNYDKGEFVDGRGFETLLHETGHFLGLSHPHEGAFTLSEATDTTDNTVMSYEQEPDPKSGYQSFDKKALQHLYGKAKSLDGWTYEYKKGALTAKGTGNDDKVIGLLHKVNKLKGAGGDDLLVGWEKNDKLEGGKGDDTLKGARGNDTLKGGDGNDKLLGDENDPDRRLDFSDKLYGGKGNDTLHGRDGSDKLWGGDGKDKIYGDTSDSWWINDDKLWGGKGNDKLWGGSGDDTVKGDAGNDKLWGGTEHDTLIGGKGKDTLKGDAGRDTLTGGKGADTLTGDDGPNGTGPAERDTFVFSTADFGAKDKITDFDAGLDLLNIAATGYSAADAAFVSQNGGSDTLVKFDGGALEILLKNVEKSAVEGLHESSLFVVV